MRICLTALFFLAPLSLAGAQDGGQPGKPTLLVSDLEAQDVTPAQAAAVTDALTQALTQRGPFQVRSAADVRALLSSDRQAQLLGCAPGESCGVDLSELSGARFVLSGSLSRLGQTYQLSLQMLDTRKNQAVARSTRLAASLATLIELAPYVAAEATGSPLPPPRSRVLPYSLLAAGGATVVGGGVVGLFALNRQSIVNEELCPGGPDSLGDCRGQGLKSQESYREQNRAIGRDKNVSVGLLLGGAALLGAGFLLLPPNESPASLALVPTGSGLAFAGVLP